MRFVIAVLLLGVAAPALAAGGYGFGGFSSDGSRFLKHGSDDRACTVALPPLCSPIDRKTAKDLGFTKPPRSRRVHGATVQVVVEDGVLIVRAGDTTVARYRQDPPVISANANVFVSPDESQLAVEYESPGRGTDVVVFTVDPVEAPPPAPPPGPGTARPPSAPAGGGNAYDRAVGKGGKWEQRMVPCDTAGVRLVLEKKDKSFDLRIDTKCQSDKNTTVLGGKWTTEGVDRLDLTFENENGRDETLACRFAECQDAPGEDCLSCADTEVGFLLKVVRR